MTLGTIQGRARWIGLLGLAGLVVAGDISAPDPVHACGGFFCNGGPGGGPTPVVQAAERVIFEQRADGKVRTYVQIAYQAAPIGFSWIVPVQAVPEIGIADPALFDELDAATNPQFRFILPGGGVSSGGGGGGCGSSADASPSFSRGGAGAMEDVDAVRVWGTSRVGDYETATILGDTAAALLDWLRAHDYDIPTAAEAILQTYVEEHHLFVAFRYSPLAEVTGVLQPIVLEYGGFKPCVPIRITAVATAPVLDVMILAFGPQRAAPAAGWMSTEPNYDAIRQDFSSARRTTYDMEVLSAVGETGGRAFITEYAAPTSDIAGAITNIEAQALVARAPYVTRFYTRITPEAMTIDPEFEFPGGPDVGRLHVIDLSGPTGALARTTSTRYAAAAPVGMLIAAIVIAARRLRRKR